MDGSYPYTSKRECRTNEFSPNGNIHQYYCHYNIKDGLTKYHLSRRCIHDKCERHKPNPSLSVPVCKENKDKFTNNTNRSAIVVRIHMPDKPTAGQQYCYPWSPEELMEDDKYKSVSISQS